MYPRIKRSTDDLYMSTNQLLSNSGFIKGRPLMLKDNF